MNENSLLILLNQNWNYVGYFADSQHFLYPQKSVLWFMLANTVTVHVYLVMKINNPYFPRHDASKSLGLSFQGRHYKETNVFLSL